MKKGIFSLMMALVLAFTGLANAQTEVVIGNGTSNGYYGPYYSYFYYSFTEMVWTADEIINAGGSAGQILDIAFGRASGTAQTNTYTVYMKNVSRSSFASSTDYETVTAGDIVFNGTHSSGVNGWETLTLDTPFEWDGSSNLMIGVWEQTSGYATEYFYYNPNAGSNRMFQAYSDTYPVDPYNLGSYSGSKAVRTYQFDLKMHITPSGAPAACPLTVAPDPADFGYRPNNCWMRPIVVTVTNEGAATDINGFDFSGNYFTPDFSDVTFPFVLDRGESFDVNVLWGTGEGQMDASLAVDYSGNRTAALFDVTAYAYEPVCPDVFEMARVVNSFPYTETISASGTPLYDNYLLPPTSVQDGPDAVWKVTFTQDQLLNATVDGENGKIAIYPEDFYGFGGPDVNNNYTGPMGGPVVSEPYDITIGNGTGTNSYQPCYAFYNNSLTEQLYLAEDLLEAGMSPGVINTIGYNSSVNFGYNIGTVRIYMANVADASAPATSTPASNMTLVYEGNNIVPTLGWNDFDLNGNFEWDGTSNLLVMFRRNHTTYNSGLSWYYTTMDYTAGAYNYSDGTSYDPQATTYALTTTANLPNTHLVGNNREGGSRDVTASIENMTMIPGTYYVVASATSDQFTVNINAETMPCPVEMTTEANLIYPEDDADGLEPAAVELQWHLSDYTTEYRLRFGSDYYCTEILVDWTTDLAESYTVRDLYNNTNYFWMVEERNSGCPQGIQSPVWGFTTHLNVPTNLHSTNTSGVNLYEGETLNLAWTAVQDRTIRQYNIYMDGDLIGSTPMNSTTTTYDVTGLTYNMGGYSFYVTAVYDEGESAPSNMITVRVTGEGNVDGYVYEQDGTTGIAGATVTKTGADEFGVPHTYTFTTGANGYYSGAMLAGEYNGVATCDGYQEVTYEHNPFTIVYDELTPDINYVMDEVFTPVGEVIAEYYPDPEDPESPYVKVYWSWNVVGAMIEDFETGDFSQFEWNIPAQYPFEITTTNPYEGAYCMQSTNYNVASSTSSIDVNVEIPYDGLMSFYKRISCESSWDNAYFYIDGAQVATFSGESGWGIKEVAITAGVHNFKWAYTKDSSVNSGEDRFFIDYIDFIHPAQPPVPGDTYTFDDGTMQGWTSIDADGDGYNWVSSSTPGNYHNAGVDLTGTGHNASAHYVISGSFANGTGMALNPDNYLVSPQVELGGIVQFYACAQDATYAAEHFGLAVSTTGNTNAADFTTVQEWTLTAKSTGKACADNRSGRAQGEWYEYTVDLSAYSGMGYVAIRHFNCSDQFILNVDDITIGEAGKSACDDRSFQFFRVYRTDCYQEGPYTPENTVVLACELSDTAYIDVSWPNAAPGVYKWGVGCVYGGNRESQISWSEPTVVPAQGQAAEATRTIVEIGNGTSSTYQTPFNSLWGYSVVEQIYTAAEIGTAGTINSISFYMDPANTSNSAQTNSVDVFMKNVTRSDFAAGYEPLAASDMVFSGTVTFNLGWTTITLDTPFQYDGNSNLMIALHEYTPGYSTRYFCYTDVANGAISYHSDSTNPDPYNLGSFSGSNYLSNYRPNIQIDITAGSGDPIQEPRESPIVWSNCLDKDMYMDNVDVTVLLNSADSPEGTVVTLTNLNEAEREMYPVDPVTLDGSGYYAWETFRRGDYAVKVELDAYEPIYDTVSIWNETHLRYVMTEILAGVGNIYVSRTGWAMWDAAGPGPVPPHGGSTFSYNFDGNGLEDWTLIDANNDGANWMHSHDYVHEVMDNEGHNASYGFAVSESFINGGVGAVTPDNYLVSPQVNFANGSTFSFWVTDGNDAYGAEHFGVAVSTSGNTNAADFTTVAEWTLLSKGEKTGERQLIDGIWYEYTVDLSAYAGQTGYIAIRHFNCYDQWVLCADDFALTSGAKDGDRHLEYYKVLCTSIDGVPIYNHNTVVPMCQLDTNDPFQAPLVEGDHYLCKVACMYSTGMSAWSEPVEWVYEPCDHWGPVDYVNLNNTSIGNHIAWDFTQGFNPYDPGHDTIPPTPGDTEFTEGFEGGLNGWNVLNASGEGTWVHSDDNLQGQDYTIVAHTGTGFAVGYSFIDYVGAVNIDSYLYTPQKYSIVNGSTLTFWADNANDTYPESFSVCVATADNPTPADFTQVWSGAAKAGNAAKAEVRHDGNRYNNWRQHTIDLSAYAGQNVYIAFHDVNYDAYEIWIDDVQLTAGAKGANAFASGMTGNAYAFNITDVANFDERVYVLYNLYNDVRFDVINGEADGMFMISAAAGYEDMDLEEAINDFMLQNNSQFRMMDKVQAADVAREYKASLPTTFANSLMMDLYVASRQNNLCETADPFCTDNGMYEFPAGVNAGSGENGPYYDCLYSTPNPAWYYMKIGEPGDMDIYMYSTPGEDIDFCCWGPFADPTSPCPNGLTADKVVSCSYSINPTEDCMIPATAQTGEYYILVITNYSNSPCNINFSKVAGSGTTDCGIMPDVDIIGFLITLDGEYLDIVGPEVRDYTHEGEHGDHVYCVRPIYPGEQTLPDHNYGWSMGCPVCSEEPVPGFCEPGAPIRGEYVWNNANDFGALISWGGTPVPPGPGDEFTEGFESGSIPTGWTTIDADGDGHNWSPASVLMAGYLIPFHGGADCITSESYSSSAGALTPDNYLVSPRVSITNGSTFSFWACAQDPSYAGEHYGVAISTTGNTSAADFTTIAEWTMTAKDAAEAGAYVSKDNKGTREGTWYQKTVDLSDYAGQQVYIAIRHFNCTDMFYLNVDDAELSIGAKDRAAELVKYNVYRSTDNVNYELIGSVNAVEGQTEYSYYDNEASAGMYYYQVRAYYSDGCESEPAPSEVNPANNYVIVVVTSVAENGEVALYPNPTNGNITINAQNMNRITVVSVLGQVVYDAEIDGDEYHINMAQFNAGVYMVRIATENGVSTQRVTVVK